MSGLAGRLDGLDDLRTGPLLRWIGAVRARTAVLILVAAALLGVVCTLLAGRDPGFLLGFFMILGTVAATLAVRRGAVYLLFPLPALLLFIASIMVGSVHDTGLESTGTTGLGVGFTQWVAAVFFPMCVATILALLVGAGRWVFGRQLLTGGAAPIQPPGNARSAAGRRRPAASDPWESGASSPRRSARPAGAGPARDSRTDRDPWGDPRITGERSQPPTVQPPTVQAPTVQGPSAQPMSVPPPPAPPLSAPPASVQSPATQRPGGQRPTDAPRPAAPRFVPRDRDASGQPPTSAPRDPAPRLPRGPRSEPRNPWS